ncbi:hypothetical protein CY35_18G047100 [Sphagnum magellanicum]|nr:hypothetical protein CY35_18G047100 [Sphagnum magellanicum]
MASAGKKVVRCKTVILASYPKGWVKEENMKVVETEVDLTLKEGDIALKLAYISLDPYYRGRMQEDKRGLYFPPFQLGKPLHGGVVAKVIESANPKFQEGDYVTGILDFCEYLVAPQGKGYSWEFVPASQELEIVDVSQVPPSYYLGVCGMPGLTAYVGLKEIGQPKPGEEVFVTAAAGAVGQVVGQLAKIYGCRVVGSAGSDLKVDLLKTYFRIDDAFNYKKETDLEQALSKYFPHDIDIYFDNVGGQTLEAVLNHVNTDARIPMCGAVSEYNKDWRERYGVRNLLNCVGRCVKMQGFLVTRWWHLKEQYLEEVTRYLKEGRVKYKEDITEGIEHLPKAFVSMLKGENIGKAVVKVGE